MLPNEFFTLFDNEIELRICLALNSKKQYYYKIYLKGTDIYIGNCGIRLLHNSDNQYLGNIEYEIFKGFNSHNYACKATQLLSQIALYFGEENLIITASPNNIASIKTIEKLKTQFIHIVDVPKKMRLYKTTKQVSVYNWNLEKEEKIK